MTFVLREEAIPKEKVRLARNYPVLIADTIGVTSLYQKLHWHNVLRLITSRAAPVITSSTGRNLSSSRGCAAHQLQ